MLKKEGSRTGFATKNDPKSAPPPPAEFLVFEQVLKQRLRRDLPRGFTLVRLVFHQTYNIDRAANACVKNSRFFW